MNHFLQTLWRTLRRFASFLWQLIRNTYTIENVKSFAAFLWESVKAISPAYKALYRKIFNKGQDRKSPIKQGAPLAAGTNVYERLLSQAVFLAIIVGIFLGAIIVSFIPYLDIKWIVVFMVVIIPILWYQMSQCRLGYDGERVVGESIAQISRKDHWRFIHSFYLGEGKSDIDHIVICPKGVFCIETKTLRKPRRGKEEISLKNGRVVAGEKALPKNPVGQVRLNAKDLRNFILEKIELSEGEEFKFVIPVLVFPGRWVNEEHDDKDIFICNDQRLGHIIDKSGDDKLSDKLIPKIYKILRQHNHSTTLDDVVK